MYLNIQHILSYDAVCFFQSSRFAASVVTDEEPGDADMADYQPVAADYTLLAVIGNYRHRLVCK